VLSFRDRTPSALTTRPSGSSATATEYLHIKVKFIFL
jgi:hypothetical protein